MKQLIVPPLLINLIMFIVGTVYGINPNLIANEVIISSPGGYVFQIQMSAIIFGVISAVIIVAGILGIRIVGSGIADASVSLIVRTTIYALTWSLLSIMTFGFLSLIPTFGYILYAIFSIMYGIGVLLQLAEVDSTSSKIQTQGGDE